MTKEQIAELVAAGEATFATINLLISFLDAKGIMSRAEFAAYLDDVLASYKEQKMNATLLRHMKMKFNALKIEPPPAVRLQ
jgi:hypothetical protein